jgi:hypothetical protein
MPVVVVKREGRKSGSEERVDKVVHFEKVEAGRLHSIGLTAYGEGETGLISLHIMLVDHFQFIFMVQSCDSQYLHGAAPPWDGVANRPQPIHEAETDVYVRNRATSPP